MSSYVLSPIGGASQQFFDNTGAVLSGGLLYTYAAGTTTPLATYADNAGVTPNANPIVLDSSGRVGGEVWLIYTDSYKFVLKDSLGNLLGTWDNVPDQVESGLITTLQTDVTALQAVADCMLRVTLTAAQTGSNGVGSVIHFDTTDFDIGSNFNLTTYEFTAPVNGNYLVTALFPFSPSANPTLGGSAAIQLYKNSSFWADLDGLSIHVADTYTLFLSGSSLITLVKNDTLKLYAYNNTGVTIDFGSSTGCALTIARIS